MDSNCPYCRDILHLPIPNAYCEACKRSWKFKGSDFIDGEQENINAELELCKNEGGEEVANLNDLSSFLKKDDLKSGDIITFVDEGNIANIDFSQAKDGTRMKKVFQITVRLSDGREKLATLNKASRDSLSNVYGKETSEWVDKEAKVRFIQQLAFGKMMDVLVLDPIE